MFVLRSWTLHVNSVFSSCSFLLTCSFCVMSLRGDLIRHKSVPSFLISLDKQMWWDQKWPNNPHKQTVNSQAAQVAGGVLLNFTIMDQFIEYCYLNWLLALMVFCRNVHLKAWQLKSGLDGRFWYFIPFSSKNHPSILETSEAKATIRGASATFNQHSEGWRLENSIVQVCFAVDLQQQPLRRKPLWCFPSVYV